VGEYAIVTFMVATIALAIGTIPDALLGKRLPTTAAKAQALVSSSARKQGIGPADARAVMARAPYGVLVKRLGRMKVTVDQAADAVLSGTASAC